MKRTLFGQNMRHLLLPLSIIASLSLLTGCQGTLYNDRINLPFLSEGVYTHYITQFVLFNLFQMSLVPVVIWVLWSVIFPPYYRMKVGDLKIELWVSKRKYPWMSRSQALIVPVAPDLKMVFGSAKMARDWGANQVQAEAEKVAPLKPGEVFVGSGSRYRWQRTALAVIFDNQKRTNPELLATALQNAMRQLASEDLTSAVLPDLTDNLMTQPNWITDEQRESTARQAARLTLDALVNTATDMRVVRIWCFDPRNADLYIEEMEKWQEEREAHAVSG